METEFVILVLKLIQSMAGFIVAIIAIRIMFNMLLKIGNEPIKRKSIQRKLRRQHSRNI